MILLLSSITDLHQKACIPRHATCYRKGPKNGICGKAARSRWEPGAGRAGGEVGCSTPGDRRLATIACIANTAAQKPPAKWSEKENRPKINKSHF